VPTQDANTPGGSINYRPKPSPSPSSSRDGDKGKGSTHDRWKMKGRSEERDDSCDDDEDGFKDDDHAGHAVEGSKGRYSSSRTGGKGAGSSSSSSTSAGGVLSQGWGIFNTKGYSWLHTSKGQGEEQDEEEEENRGGHGQGSRELNRHKVNGRRTVRHGGGSGSAARGRVGRSTTAGDETDTKKPPQQGE